MKSRALAAWVALLSGLACLGSAQARANVTYTYSGNVFTDVKPPFTTSDRITGSFVVSQALGDSLSDATITPKSFSFSDGVQTFTNTTPGVGFEFIEFSTTATGAISKWLIAISVGPELSGDSIGTENEPTLTIPEVFDEDFVGNNFGGNNNPGTWSVSSVPEPSSAVIFGSGLLGLVLLLRRRRTPSI